MPERKKQRLSAIVGANITARRKLKGWNQADFAERLGIGADSLSRIERGHVAPRFQTLEKMAALLECTVADLFHTSEDNIRYGDGRLIFEAFPESTRREVIFMAEKIIRLMRSDD